MHSQFAPVAGVRVIGLGHKARHGKDTVAAYIVATVPGAMRFAFADDLYAVARVMHGMTTKDAPLLQRLGVEARAKDPDVWIRAVYSKIVDAKPALAVVTDVRFENEMAAIKAMGGRCVKVTRLNEDGTVFRDPSRPADHVSEVALDEADWDDHLVARTGDLASLHLGVDDVLADMGAS